MSVITPLLRGLLRGGTFCFWGQAFHFQNAHINFWYFLILVPNGY
jgi:hypothetical protein